MDQKLNTRIQSLDVLLGLSLLGIFITNMVSFHSPSSYYNPYEWWKYGDAAVYAWLDVIADGSFYPILAMIFGYSMVIILQHAKTDGLPSYKIMIRKLMTLLLIGGIHAFLVWYGDILITFSLLGFILLFFLRLPGRLLMSIGVGLYLVPQFVICSWILLNTLLGTVSLADYINLASLIQSEVGYANGTFLDIIAQRFSDWVAHNGADGLLRNLLVILPMMMIGAGAAKRSWLQQATKQKKKWLIILGIALPLGVAGKLLPFFTQTSMSSQYIQDAFGGPLLGIAYVATVVLIMTNKTMTRLLRPLATVGRIPIVIYLTQSLIGTFIFYSYGLGLYGQISLATSTWLAIGIFVIQVVCAEIWLSISRFGQMDGKS